MALLDHLRSALDALSPAEQRVARLVLADPRAFVSMPVTEIARQCKVSSPTVVRFCRSLGHEGLSDFKLKLAASLGRSGVPFVHQAVSVGDTCRELVDKVVDNSTQALGDFRNTAGLRSIEHTIDTLARTIAAGRRIEFYGVGNSGIVAMDAQHKFFRMGCHSAAYTDGHLQVMGAAMLTPEDTAVIFSNSGRSRDLLDAAELARKQGAATVAVTASGSPLAKLARIHIAADHPESYEEYSPMVSRLLHLVIVDVLTTGVALRLGPELQPRLHVIKKTLRSKRYR